MGLIVSHEETVAGHDMRVKGRTETLINGFGNLALDLAESRLVDRLLVHIVGTDSSCPGVRSRVTKDQAKGSLTLVVMELVFVVAIKLAKNLDHVGVGIGTTKGVTSTIETKNEFDVFIRSNRLRDMKAVS